jgi:octaprenyl-diphosphate synthase
MPDDRRLMESPKQSQILTNGLYRVIKPFSVIEEYLLQVQQVISEQLCEHPQTAGIERLVAHIRSQSGKMLRPGLVLLSGLCCGEIIDEHIRVAAIFEIIHEATLLHDDVIDEADKRRGQQALNRLHGNESAVLLGDFLLSKVFSMSAQLRSDVSVVIASAAGRMCQGELNQNLQKRNWHLTQQQYIEIIADKTAEIFRSCCQIGARLGGAEEDTAQKLGDYGLNLGIAFQISDDLLDIVGDEGKAGKTLGTDFVETKPTLPLIHLLGSVDDSRRTGIINIVGSSEPKARGELAELLADNGSIEYSMVCLRQYVRQAIESLESLPAGAAKTALIDTAEFVAARAGK